MIHRANLPPLTRRDALKKFATGFGMAGFASMASPLAARDRGQSVDSQGSSLCAQGEARHRRVPAGRAVADRFVRLQADAREVRRQAAAVRNAAHRVRDRQPDEVAVQLQEVRQARHRGQRALPAYGESHRRVLYRAVDDLRHPQSRAVRADDEHGERARGAALDGLVGGLRTGHGEPESAGLHRPQRRRRVAATRSARLSCRRSTRGRWFPTICPIRRSRSSIWPTRG